MSKYIETRSTCNIIETAYIETEKQPGETVLVLYKLLNGKKTSSTYIDPDNIISLVKELEKIEKNIQKNSADPTTENITDVGLATSSYSSVINVLPQTQCPVCTGIVKDETCFKLGSVVIHVECIDGLINKISNVFEENSEHIANIL